MMQNILQRYLALPVNDDDAITLLCELVGQVSPKKSHKIESAIHAVQALCHILNSNPQYAVLLRDGVLNLLVARRPVSLFADSGIQPNTGFFSEMARRLGHKLLPKAVDKNYLKDVFGLIFNQSNDDEWVSNLPDAVCLELISALRFDTADSALLNGVYRALLESVQVLSYRLSASGLEPELMRNHEDLENYTSPFITQNLEITAFVNSVTSAEGQDAATTQHAEVMLLQCRAVITKIRSNSANTGTSIELTFLMQRMAQQLDRLEMLLDILAGLAHLAQKQSPKQAGQSVKAKALSLFKVLVAADAQKNHIAQHFSENMALIALRVTENASRTGEHYITANRHEYFKLMRSAMGWRDCSVYGGD